MPVIFRQTNSWLAYRSENAVRTNHIELFNSQWSVILNFCKKHLQSKNSYLIILGVFVVSTAINLFARNISFFNFIEIELDTAKSLVDQRTSNIATIISITLAVIALLINNIGMKESISYNHLFESTFLYPIIYFTISTIGYFFIVSTIRDWIDPNIFIRLVIQGIYFALLILIFIAFLFKKIVDYFDRKSILKYLGEKLLNEGEEFLIPILIRRYSKNIFSQSMEAMGLTLLSVNNMSDTATILFNNVPEPQHFEIIDVNISKLERYKKKHIGSNNGNYVEIMLCSYVSDFDIIKKVGSNSTDSQIRYLKRSLILKPFSPTKKVVTPFRTYFEGKLEDSVSEGSKKDLKIVLEYLEQLYELEMKHLSWE